MFWKDIKKIRKSIKGITKTNYQKLEEELERKKMFLEENPYLYQSFETNPNIRRFFIQKYVVFYKVEGKNIRVIRILSQKTNYNPKRIHLNKIPKELEFNNRK